MSVAPMVIDSTRVMAVSDWRECWGQDSARVEFSVEMLGRKSIIYYEILFPEELKGQQPLQPFPKGDIILASVLLPAMKLGLRIEGLPAFSEAAVSGRIDKIQDLLTGWYPDLQRVEYESLPESNADYIPFKEDVEQAPMKAVFFSGGVDSWHTLLENRQDISCLISVHGFDVPITDQISWNLIYPKLKEAADRMNLPLLVVNTNIKSFGNAHIDWLQFHGSAIRAVAGVLSPLASRFYVASSASEASLKPLGSHPDLDPLWSGRVRQVIHHGCHATRLEKTSYISQEKIALDCLRVCWINPQDYNCSHCRKCGITIMALDICGKLKEASTFHSSDINRLAFEADFSSIEARIYYDELIDGYRTGGHNPSVLRRLLWARRIYKCKCFLERVHLVTVGRIFWRPIKAIIKG